MRTLLPWTEKPARTGAVHGHVAYKKDVAGLKAHVLAHVDAVFDRAVSVEIKN